MLVFVARRLLQVLPILLSVTLVAFGMIQLMPGTIADLLVPPGAPPSLVAEIGRLYGFDRPVWEQYTRWLAQILSGNLGTSMVTGRPILPELLAAMANTLKVTVFGGILGFGTGILSGALAALNRGRWPDRLFSAVAIAGVSVPHYWLAILLVTILSVQLNWLPAQGMGADGLPLTWDQWRHMILPILTLSLIPMGVVGRLSRAVALETLSQDFVGALSARGLGRARIAWHVAKNAAPPVLALMGLQFGYLLGGSILVETVFNWPGTGQLLNQAIFSRDFTIIQATVMVLALLFVLVNLGVDILQGVIDPRMRR